jgi:trypsin
MAADFSAKIVGGTKADEGEFPYIVSLSLAETRSHFCGGVLLDSKTVLTAAHCSVDYPANQVRVRAGSNVSISCSESGASSSWKSLLTCISQLWASGGKQVNVASIKVHPKYDEDTLNNDIAIWSLARPIRQDENIKYISLPKAGSDPAANTTVTVAGWGLLDSSAEDIPRDLRKVSVPVISRAKCNASYNRNDTQITQQMFCAGSTGKDSCQGDSGGPVVDVASSTLLGLVSWGFDCALPEYPGVYTNVGQFVDFIRSEGNKTANPHHNYPYWV